MDSDFDPYIELPFNAYLDLASPQAHQDNCLSLMHFIEGEKFLGVDAQYRKFIHRIQERDDFMLETAGVSQARRRSDWADVRHQLITAGVWMQLVQNKDALVPLVLEGTVSCSLGPIDDAIKAVRNRLLSDDPLRKVLIVGDDGFDDREVVFAMLDAVFSSRLPDELLVTRENGVSRFAAEYAHKRYIPLRIVSSVSASPAETVDQAVTAATHVFLATSMGAASSIAQGCFEAATEAGKIAHSVQLETLCA